MREILFVVSVKDSLKSDFTFDSSDINIDDLTPKFNMPGGSHNFIFY